MEVAFRSVTRTFGREVVFRGVDHVFAAHSRTALLGPNGSGKSTLLQVVGGALAPTNGTVEHRCEGRTVDPDAVYRLVAFATPYLGLYEDLSLRDTLAFHHRLKPFRPGFAAVDVARTAYLDRELDKPVRQFSSGMRQRLKLVLALLSDVPLLLLDEPTSNLDAHGIAWFGELLRDHLLDRTLVVASNRVEAETALCTARLDVMAWKPAPRR